jgi:hypothetical protein
LGFDPETFKISVRLVTAELMSLVSPTSCVLLIDECYRTLAFDMLLLNEDASLGRTQRSVRVYGMLQNGIGQPRGTQRFQRVLLDAVPCI